MESYNGILQIIAIIIIVLIIFSFFRLLVSIARSRRIEDFAIAGKGSSMTFEQRLYGVVYKLSDFIGELVVFNTVANAYEKYVVIGDNKFKKGMDFIEDEYGNVWLSTYSHSVYVLADGKSDLQRIKLEVESGFMYIPEMYLTSEGKIRLLTFLYGLFDIDPLTFEVTKSVDLHM